MTCPSCHGALPGGVCSRCRPMPSLGQYAMASRLLNARPCPTPTHFWADDIAWKNAEPSLNQGDGIQ